MLTTPKPTHRKARQTFSEVNVTPLVDVMLVLLVIFMLTAPLLTVSIPVDLPKTQAARSDAQTEPLIVSVDSAGQIYLQETKLEIASLIERLLAIAGSTPETKIYIRGDRNLAYGKIMEIMGAIAAAGFHKVALMAELPQGADASNDAKTIKP